jgi:arylsulfatase A-like enzyme
MMFKCLARRAALLAGFFALPFFTNDLVANGTNNTPNNARVVLLCIDGLHELDLANWIKAHPTSAMASLVQTGVRYTSAYTPRPSDSFPTFLALVTGGSPVSTGVWYDDSYDRSLWPPNTTSGPTGTAVTFTEGPDINPLALDGGGGLNPGALPRDPARGGAVVYPHNYLRVNTIFEVVKAAGGRTAYAEKHLTYEIAHGPSGQGVDDLYTPEINANNSFGIAITKSVPATENYDDLKVQAIVNQIHGLDHTGTNAAPIPTLFGMNFQAVSVAQKLKVSVTATGGSMPGAGSYADGAGTPGLLLADALQHTDNSVSTIMSNLVQAGLYNSTFVVLVGKHGNSPVDTNRFVALNPANLTTLIDPAIATIAKATIDDVGLFWLADQSKAEAVAAQFRANQNNTLYNIQDVFAGESLRWQWTDPLVDPRAPDVLLFPKPGTIFTTSNKKFAEHGGGTEQDTHIALVVSHPSLIARVAKTPVNTTQVAPTILQLLGLNPLSLQAVVQERTALLPGFDPVQAAANPPFQPGAFSYCPTNYVQLQNGQATLQLSEFQNHNYILQGSTDLTNWTSISTNRMQYGGSLTLSDPSAASFSNRFYRAVVAP